MIDTLWFYAGCAIIAFFVLQVAGVPLTALPLIVLAAVLFTALLAILVFIVTLPRRLYERLTQATTATPDQVG